MKRISLENFRCYENLALDLRPGINLLVGDNASGKTSLLRGLRYALSSFFAGYSDENTRLACPADDDFMARTSGGTLLQEKPICIRFAPDHSQYDEVAVGDRLVRPGAGEEEYEIVKKSKKNSRALVSGLAAYRDYSRALLHSDAALPLFANFSTEDIHAVSKIDGRKFRQYAQKPSFGYYGCLDGDGFFPYWLRRLLVLQEGRKNEYEIEAVRRALIAALGTGDGGCGIIGDMDIRHNLGAVYYEFADGREAEAAHLSDGYRRVAAIVTSIAFRSAILNGRLYGADSPRLTRGTVLIDEIDMHLHPTLQSSILKGLRTAFPNIQFVATTHAPMVMSCVETGGENVIYKLSYDGGRYLAEEQYAYGMDASTITNVVLNQTPRAKEVDDELNALFTLIDDGRTDEARQSLNEMRERFGNRLPDLSRAETMLDFRLMDEDEED